MSSLLSAELSATCNALGYYDIKTKKYYADENTLETVKDLIRYLRRDDETHDIRRRLGETKVLQTDLLPLMKSYWEENDLFDVILRLVVNLTTPALILWNEEIPSDKTVRNYYLQIEDHLQNYKEAFADEGVWAVLSTRLSKILEIDIAERGEENSLIIERILILIRNILYVPADSMEKRPDNDASIHDQVLWALHQSGMLDIILYITSSSNEQAYYMHIMEILSFMLREQNPKELAKAALQRSQTEKIRDETELLAIRHQETTKKQQQMKKYTGARHSRFGGTFVINSMKSISENDLIYHKPLNSLNAVDFDVHKRKPKTPKNRMPIVSNTSERRSAFTIRLFLKEFCIEFLNGAYNTMMYYAKDNLVRAASQTNDESYYLWSLKFFMEFNRSYKFEVKLVSETMSIQIFHYVQQLSEKYFDLMQTDKKKIRLWSKRLHLALQAYQELFHTLCFMDKSQDEAVKESAKIIKSNIFYVPEYREFVLTLLINYNELKMSDVYLKDLMETQHIFLKMFESFCDGGKGSILVQKRIKHVSRKKGRKSNQPARKPQSQSSQMHSLENRWDEASQQLSVVLENGGEFVTDILPFDAALDIPIDEQKADAMMKVQRKLRNLEFESAIGLLRAAREVWPENDSFGSQNMSPEEEFLAMREIFFADLGENDLNTQIQEQETPAVDESSDNEENEEDEESSSYAETDLSFREFTDRLPHPKIVKACGLALTNFETNSIYVNHCIIKLLHRIAFDCKMYVMVFQLSIFRTFQKIFSMKTLPQHQELVKFASFIMRQFFKCQETNRKLFVEALFWKSKRDAYEIENNYESMVNKPKNAQWTEEQEDELRQLFMEHQNNKIEDDVVDWIVDNLIDNTRSRRIVLSKLKDMYLLSDDYKKKKAGVKSRPPQIWGSAEERQLSELYEQFKDSPDPLDCIITRLEIKRPKNRIIEKMLVMGLIQDKKELRKKRVRNNSNKSKMRKSRKPSDTENSDSDDDDRGSSSHLKNMVQQQPKNKSSRKGQKRKVVAHTVNRDDLVKHLLRNVEAGRQESLEWLKESLSDAIEDFEDGSDESIPLVPIMDYAQAAIENKEFCEMLKAFGICEPSDEQEVYWRIPTALTVDKLKEYCSMLQGALDNTLAASESPNNIRNESSDSDDENIFERLRKMRQQPVQDNEVQKNSEPDILHNTTLSEHTNMIDKDSSDDDENIFERLKHKRPQSKQDKTCPELVTSSKIDDPSSNTIANENHEEVFEVNESNPDSQQDTNISKKKNLAIFDSDSGEETNIMDGDTIDDGAKRSRQLSDSDSERPTFKRSRVIIESDED